MPKTHRISSADKSIKHSKNTKTINARGSTRQKSKQKINQKLLQNLLSAFEKGELLKAAVFLNKLDKIDLNQVDLTTTSPISGGNLLSILCRITDESVRDRVDDLLKKLFSRKDREHYINQADDRDSANCLVQKTPLQYLVENHKDLTIQQFDQLIQAGCHAGCKDARKRDLLYSAVHASNYTLALHLIDTYHLKLSDMDINNEGILSIIANQQFTPQTKDFIEQLWAEKKINVHDVNVGEDKDDLRYANFRHILNHELSPRHDPSPLIRAMDVKNNEYIQWLLEHGAVFNMEDIDKTYSRINSLTTTPEEKKFCESLRVLQKKTFALYMELLNTKTDHPQYQLLKNKIQLAEKSFDDLARAFIFYLTTPDKTFDVVEKFHNDCINVLNTSVTSDLTKHRGWSNVYKNIAIHLALLVTTAGFGNIVSMGYNYWQSDRKTMFFQSDTASIQSIKAVTSEAEHIAKKSK